MKKQLAMFVVLVGLFGGQAVHADSRLNLNGGDGTQGFEFPIVRSDADIKKMGLTRELYNKQNPAAESQWRRAWAAKGTKRDMSTFQLIRRNTAAPTDAPKGQ